MTNALYQYHEYNKDDERMTFLLTEEGVGIIPAIKNSTERSLEDYSKCIHYSLSLIQ